MKCSWGLETLLGAISSKCTGSGDQLSVSACAEACNHACNVHDICKDMAQSFTLGEGI